MEMLKEFDIFFSVLPLTPEVKRMVNCGYFVVW